MDDQFDSSCDYRVDVFICTKEDMNEYARVIQQAFPQSYLQSGQFNTVSLGDVSLDSVYFKNNDLIPFYNISDNVPCLLVVNGDPNNARSIEYMAHSAYLAYQFEEGAWFNFVDLRINEAQPVIEGVMNHLEKYGSYIRNHPDMLDEPVFFGSDKANNLNRPDSILVQHIKATKDEIFSIREQLRVLIEDQNEMMDPDKNALFIRIDKGEVNAIDVSSADDVQDNMIIAGAPVIENGVMRIPCLGHNVAEDDLLFFFENVIKFSIGDTVLPVHIESEPFTLNHLILSDFAHIDD